MFKKTSILKFYSIFFLVLTLCALAGSSAVTLIKKDIVKKKELITKKTDNSQSNEDSEKETLIETPFNAVVNAGLQWDFSKQLYVLPVFIVFFVPEKITFIPHVFTTPLAYFITLFHTSICVNAP